MYICLKKKKQNKKPNQTPAKKSPPKPTKMDIYRYCNISETAGSVPLNRRESRESDGSSLRLVERRTGRELWESL